MYRTFVIVMLCAAARADAQARGPASEAAGTADHPAINAWASLTLGPGYASNRNNTRIGGQLGGVVSYGRWIAAYRRGGASGIESGGAYDDALLFGRRWRNDPTTVYVAIGPARVFDESTGEGRLGVGFSAGPGANARVFGLGLTVFGAASRQLGFVGIGITADAGWIR